MSQAKQMEKTNVMRILDAAGIEYQSHSCDVSGTDSAVQMANRLGADPKKVFKTLVTVGKSGGHYVFMIPAEADLNLKKAAAAVGEKAVEMIKQKELLPLTGYVHGGCSPIGMKKAFPTRIHLTAADYDTIFFSAGKIGRQIEMPLSSLQKAIAVQAADLTQDPARQ